MSHWRGWVTGIALAVAGATLTGCVPYDVVRLAGDDTHGRNNGTAGSAQARAFLIEQLKPIAQGLNTAATGDAAYTQALPGGTNVVAVIPGTDLADQYVVVGAHYDHLGDSCATVSCAQDTIYNGATDNAAGVAAALAIARSIAAQPTKPRRSVVIALWDEEEDGLLGSRYYTQHPLVPLARTVGYVNFDIQGSDLLPSLRNTSFAVASETGGTRFQDIVRSAIGEQALDTTVLSSVFGLGRSDYVNFIGAGVPTVFFTDATGPCYHTVDDEIGVVDFDKLDAQIATSLSVTRELASTATPPAFASGTPLATFDDAVGAARVINRAWADRGRFSATDQATLTRLRADAQRIVADGRAAFDAADVNALLGDARLLRGRAVARDVQRVPVRVGPGARRGDQAGPGGGRPLGAGRRGALAALGLARALAGLAGGAHRGLQLGADGAGLVGRVDLEPALEHGDRLGGAARLAQRVPEVEERVGVGEVARVGLEGGDRAQQQRDGRGRVARVDQALAEVVELAPRRDRVAAGGRRRRRGGGRRHALGLGRSAGGGRLGARRAGRGAARGRRRGGPAGRRGRPGGGVGRRGRARAASGVRAAAPAPAARGEGDDGARDQGEGEQGRHGGQAAGPARGVAAGRVERLGRRRGLGRRPGGRRRRRRGRGGAGPRPRPRLRALGQGCARGPADPLVARGGERVLEVLDERDAGGRPVGRGRRPCRGRGRRRPAAAARSGRPRRPAGGR